jgi:hypothetical protein
MKYFYFFDTASIGASEIEGTNVQVSFGGERINPSFSEKNETNFIVNLALGANYPLNTLFTLGAGIDVEPLRGRSVDDGANSYHKKYAFSGFFTPGFNLTSDKHVYGKIGYGGVAMERNDETKTYYGPLYALGYKQIIMPDYSGWYTQAEINYAKYKKNTDEIKKTGAILGLGYRFKF